MKVLIVGASGLVGSNCLKHFTEQGWDAKGTYFSYEVPNTVYYNTLDPNDANNFDINSFNPDVIVHCGALTHVDYCESNIEESYEKTVQSTINLVSAAKNCNAKFVFISTDYVFDGTDGPYLEDHPTNPLSIYGKHKLEAEEYVRKEIPNSLVLRVTNVYGDEARGKNFVARIVQQCIDNNKLTLKLPYDQFACPTNAWDIARAMFVLLRDSKEGIYHIGGTDYMNRVELALRILQYFPNAEYELIPMSTAELGQPAARPLIGGFVTRKFNSEYPDMLFGNIDSYLTSFLKRQ